MITGRPVIIDYDNSLEERSNNLKTNPGNGYFMSSIYSLLQYNILRNLPASMKNSIILLICIFEPSVVILICRLKCLKGQSKANGHDS